MISYLGSLRLRHQQDDPHSRHLCGIGGMLCSALHRGLHPGPWPLWQRPQGHSGWGASPCTPQSLQQSCADLLRRLQWEGLLLDLHRALLWGLLKSHGPCCRDLKATLTGALYPVFHSLCKYHILQTDTLAPKNTFACMCAGSQLLGKENLLLNEHMEVSCAPGM